MCALYLPVSTVNEQWEVSSLRGDTAEAPLQLSTDGLPQLAVAPVIWDVLISKHISL